MVVSADVSTVEMREHRCASSACGEFRRRQRQRHVDRRLQAEFQRKLVGLLPMVDAGVRVASQSAAMSDTTASPDRRVVGADRRKLSRGGRREADPHTSWRWRRLAWLFAAYAVYLSVRSLPATVKDFFTRKHAPA
jgi:hypothetical protein